MLHITEVEAYRRYNPYILNGYRKRLSFASCLKSVFSWHNQTMNIWTHLLGFFFFLYYFIKDIIIYSGHRESLSLTDLMILCTILICYQACMILSVTYHIFDCHSERINDTCLCLDEFGIILSLIAS